MTAPATASCAPATRRRLPPPPTRRRAPRTPARRKRATTRGRGGRSSSTADAAGPVMQQVRLGRTDDTISAIGYGAMALSTAPRPAEDVAQRAIAAALDAGITLFDTADVYSLDND